MKSKFLMGASDAINRSPSNTFQPTELNRKLRTRLTTAAIETAFAFYNDFFNTSNYLEKSSQLAQEYDEVLHEAQKLNLLQPGGIPEKDHLSLWCLGKALQPKQYVESGVFIGSSLHAILNSGSVEHAVGIDPILKSLRVTGTLLKSTTLIDDKDFSEIDFPKLKKPNLVYFDDHINAAKRIIESHDKGFQYVAIDDATGIEGLCQRLYPAFPTVPMVLKPHHYSAGDIICWSAGSTARTPSLANMLRKLALKHKHTPRLRIEFTPEILDMCHKAGSLVERASKLPDLGDYVPQRLPGCTINTTKYIVRLKNKAD